MVAVLGPFEALPYYIHTYIYDKSWWANFFQYRVRLQKPLEKNNEEFMRVF
jgi:hypothetical protein